MPFLESPPTNELVLKRADGEDPALLEECNGLSLFTYSPIHSPMHAFGSSVSQLVNIPSRLNSLKHLRKMLKEGIQPSRQGLHSQIAQMHVSSLKIKIISGLLISFSVF